MRPDGSSVSSINRVIDIGFNGQRKLCGSFQGRIFIFVHRRGGKIFGGVQVIRNVPFLMLWEGHEMANQSAPGG